MAVYLDRKYLLLISSKLRNFKQKKDDLFNFSCPFCGDSKKNKLKARGYIYRKNNDYFYICHNCSVSTTFSKFLKHNDEDYSRQYTLERYTIGDIGHHNYEKPKFNLQGPKPGTVFINKKLTIKDVGKLIPSLNTLTDDHVATQYISNRKIPKEFWNEIFYTETYKDFLDQTFPDHGNEDVPNDERIVLFYTNENGEITNVTGRSIHPNRIRYCTVKVGEEKKIFGLHRLHPEGRIYVFEGQFDSFFIPNSIASGDSNLGSAADYMDTNDVTLVYDNEPRNKEIVKQVHRSIEKGYTVALFPDSIPYKDINEMILSGMSAVEIKTIIDSNTSQGLEAKLRFIQWKKC
jgi:hypothetical protein